MANDDGRARVREEEVVSEANGGTAVRVAKSRGLAFVALAKAYLDGARKPLTFQRCQELVRPHAAQPNLMLHNLEQDGLVSGDAARGTGRSRIVFVDKTVFVKEGDEEVQVWPEIAGVPAPNPAPPRPGRPPSGPILTPEETLAYLRGHYPAAEFTVKQVIDGTGMTQGSVYDRVRKFLADGDIEQSGGTKGRKDDPARYRIREPAPVAPAADADRAVRSEIAPGIKSKAELLSELTAKRAELERLNEATRRRVEAERRRQAAESEAARLRVLLLEQERAVAEADAELVEIGPVDDRLRADLEAGIARDAEILEQYDDILARLTRH